MKAPDMATLCTVYWEGLDLFVNCAGFKRPFFDIPAAATFLDMPWPELESLCDAGGVVFLIRRDVLKGWCRA